MARIPKLDSAGRFLAADVNAQIDARAKAATAPLLDGKRGVEATELGTEHLDTVTTPGTYTQSANLEATLEAGYPMTRGGVLQVERSVSKTMVWQTYTTYAPSPSTPAQTWQRGAYNGTWTGWSKIGGGSGIEQVSGTITLDSTGAPIREFWSTGATTFKANGEDTLISSATGTVWRRTGSGSWGYQVVPDEWTTPAAGPDTTKPSPGALEASSINATGFTLKVIGASDNRALNAAPYRFSLNNGATFTTWQAASSHVASGLTTGTVYPCCAEVRDAAGNIARTATLSVAPTAPAEVYTTTVLFDDFNRADGPLGTSPISTGQSWEGAYQATHIVGGALKPAAGAGIVGVKHNASSGSTETTFTFKAPANMDPYVIVAPRIASVPSSGVQIPGLRFKITRSSSRDIVEMLGDSGQVTTTFNNGNGSLASNNWAHLPGRIDYATAQDYSFRIVVKETEATVYCNDQRILAGTFAALPATPYLALNGSSLPILDNLAVKTP